MRAMRLPVFILLVLLAVSLAQSAAITRRCRIWTATVDAVDAAAQAEQWEKAAELLDGMERDWAACRVWLRITVSHTALNQAKSLLAQSQLLCRLREGSDLRSALAELGALLRQIGLEERLSWENIL